jgi:hypothetical protein
MKPWDTNLQEVVDFIKSAAVKHPYEEDGNTLKPGVVAWSWVKNWNKKYISLRIDLRDGKLCSPRQGRKPHNLR